MNKIIWTKKPGVLTNNLIYDEQKGFALHCPEDTEVKSFMRLDLKLTAKVEIPNCILINNNRNDIVIHNNYILLAPRRKVDLYLDISPLNSSLTILRNEIVGWVYPISTNKLSFREVNRNTFNNKI